MGRSTTGDLACNDDVVALIADFIDRLEAGPVWRAQQVVELAGGDLDVRPDHDQIGLALGAIAGLVGITAPSGYVEFYAAPIIGPSETKPAEPAEKKAPGGTDGPAAIPTEIVLQR